MQVLVVYYSMYGHIDRMAQAIAEADRRCTLSDNELAGARFQAVT
jgi:flavorubredoxin